MAARRSRKQHHPLLGGNSDLAAAGFAVVQRRVEHQLVAGVTDDHAPIARLQRRIGDNEPVRKRDERLRETGPALPMRHVPVVGFGNLLQRPGSLVLEEGQLVVVDVEDQRPVQPGLGGQRQLKRRHPRLAREQHVAIETRREIVERVGECRIVRPRKRNDRDAGGSQRLPYRLAVLRKLPSDEDGLVFARQDVRQKVGPSHRVVPDIPRDDSDLQAALGGWLCRMDGLQRLHPKRDAPFGSAEQEVMQQRIYPLRGDVVIAVEVGRGIESRGRIAEQDAADAQEMLGRIDRHAFNVRILPAVPGLVEQLALADGRDMG